MSNLREREKKEKKHYKIRMKETVNVSRVDNTRSRLSDKTTKYSTS